MAKLQFGAAIRDITPIQPVMLHGYAARTRKSCGVSEPLRLGALAVSDGSTTLLFITIDTTGIHSSEATALAVAAEEATGVRRSNVIVAASHTHFAPQMSLGVFTSPEIGMYRPESSVTTRITNAAVSAAKESVAALTDVTVEQLRVDVPAVAFNRRTIRADGSVETNFRYPERPERFTFAPVDAELTALRFTTPAGTGALLVNFGCHPVAGGYDQEASFYRVSSDYVYYLRRVVEEAWGLPVFFTLGAAGDVVPRDRYRESRRRIGRILGESIVLADRMFTPVEGEVFSRFFEMPVDTILSFHPAEAKTDYEREREASLARREATPGFADALLGRFRSELYPENRFAVPVQLARVGPISFAALPFEVLSEFARRLKTDVPRSVLVSCAGGYQGYLPFEYEYARGGYEASDRSTHFAPGTADALYERITSELASL